MQLKFLFSLMTSPALVTMNVPLHLLMPVTLPVPSNVDAIAFPSVSVPAHEPVTVPRARLTLALHSRTPSSVML